MTLHQQSPSKHGRARIPGTLAMGWATPGEDRGETVCVPSLQVQQDKGPRGANRTGLVTPHCQGLQKTQCPPVSWLC